MRYVLYPLGPCGAGPNIMGHDVGHHYILICPKGLMIGKLEGPEGLDEGRGLGVMRALEYDITKLGPSSY